MTDLSPPPGRPARQRLKGPLGLFLTSWDPKETLEWFQTFTRPAFARQNFPAATTLTLPAGPIKNAEDELFPHSMEPQLRSCGLMTSLEKGVPTLKVETQVCREGEKLSGEKARLLLMLGYMHAVSRSLDPPVRPRPRPRPRPPRTQTVD